MVKVITHIKMEIYMMVNLKITILKDLANLHL